MMLAACASDEPARDAASDTATVGSPLTNAEDVALREDLEAARDTALFPEPGILEALVAGEACD